MSATRSVRAVHSLTTHDIGEERFKDALRKSELDCLVDAASGPLHVLFSAMKQCQPFDEDVSACKCGCRS